MDRIKSGIRKLNNRGSSIVIVIIAMAMIGILATSILWMSYMNYQIKVNDIKNKDSFYSAETVVEQIMAGVQNEASAAASAAYKEVMKNWDALDSGNNVSAETNRYHIFVTTYIDTLYEDLALSGHSGRYDRDTLKGYVDSYLFTKVDSDAWTNGNEAGEAEKPATIEIVNNNSILLRNIYVAYTDTNDVVSIVSTDIRIDVPKLSFSQNGSIDELYEYALIGNQGISVDSSLGTVNMKGSLYAGTDKKGKGGLAIHTASKLTIEEATRVISGGAISVTGPSAAFSVRENSKESCEVYAQNLKLESGTLSLDGKVYVANDLSLNGNGSKATVSGDYYGYGTTTGSGLTGEDEITPEESSAIIVNGRDSTVDFREVSRLLLAGRAYIGQQEKEEPAQEDKAQEDAGEEAQEEPAQKSNSVLMGETIAVKGGQIAYLVPAECIGVSGDEDSCIGQNPVSGEQAARMLAMQDATSELYDEAFKEIDFTKSVYRLGGKALSDFGVNSMKNIRKVSTQYHNNTRTYYYLVMDKENAARYFVQYYNFNANKEAVDRYFHAYASGGILLGDVENGTYTILGNSLVSSTVSESGVTLLTSVDQSSLSEGETEEGEEGQDTPQGGYEETGENAEEVADKMAKTEAEVLTMAEKIAGEYQSLCYDLTTGKTIEEENTKTVFDNLVKEKDMDTYLNDRHKNSETFQAESGLKAYITKKDVTLSEIPDAGKVRLIISEGNVTLDKSFEGLVIAKGKIIIAKGVSKVSYNKSDLSWVLNATTGVEGETVTPLAFFTNGGGSLLEGAAEADVDEDGNLILDYSEIVRYANWVKK